MSTPRVVLVRTGSANLASVQAGFRRLGAEVVISEDPAEVRAAPRVVLPGVGALGPTRRRLDGLGLDAAIGDRVRAGRPTFAVCLGLQLLLEGSDESPDASGLGLLPGWAQRFDPTVRVPQLGWNRVVAPPAARFLRTGDYYFANSYRLVVPPPGTVCGMAEHGGRFVAAFERGALLACQFHPELSGPLGASVMGRWLEGANR